MSALSESSQSGPGIKNIIEQTSSRAFMHAVFCRPMYNHYVTVRHSGERFPDSSSAVLPSPRSVYGRSLLSKTCSREAVDTSGI